MGWKKLIRERHVPLEPPAGREFTFQMHGAYFTMEDRVALLGGELIEAPRLDLVEREAPEFKEKKAIRNAGMKQIKSGYTIGRHAFSNKTLHCPQIKRLLKGLLI